MSERVRTLTVLLERDMAVGLGEDADIVRTVISQIKGVEDVQYGESVTHEEYMRREAAVSDFRLLLYKFLHLFSYGGVTSEDKVRRIREILEHNVVRRS